MNYDFGIRIDLGGNIGSGHFFRCIGIAEELNKKGVKVIFIINDKDEIKSHLNSKKISYHVLESDNDEKRIVECKKLSENISKLIIDLPFNNELYSKEMSKNNYTIVIDDLGNKKIFSQLLFNGSIVDEYQNYVIDKKITKYFNGTKYMILRTEFEMFRKKIKAPRQEIKKILITFGGTDEKNITKKILPYFIDKNYDVSLLLGPSYKHNKKIEEVIEKNNHIKIFSNIENIAELFSKQDLIISSSGVTTYEIACLGIPCIFIPNVEHEVKTAKAMEKKGFGINYGFWDDDFDRLDAVLSGIMDHKIRCKMYQRGRKLVDGKGLSRIIKIISQE